LFFKFTARSSHSVGQSDKPKYEPAPNRSAPRKSAKMSRPGSSMMDGPGAPGGPGGPGGPGAVPVQMRKDFPETWIWEEIPNSK
jgi:hypothetical protein